MEHNHEIYSVSASDNEDYPNSQDLITIFENCFSKELNKGNYILCAICFDIHLKDIINGIEHKKDAINVRFITRNISKDIILSYIFNPDETVVFK